MKLDKAEFVIVAVVCLWFGAVLYGANYLGASIAGAFERAGAAIHIRES